VVKKPFYNSKKTPTETPSSLIANAAALPLLKPMPQGHKVQVLLAEDNIVNQKVALKMLEKLGIQVDIAQNGKEAVQLSEEKFYDLIFMDCQMPEMDGFDATRAIREQEKKLQRSATLLPSLPMPLKATKPNV
jgi:CheY-like chemotaxis protein